MKKKTKIVVAFTIVLAMVLAYFSPLVNVVAETYGSGEYHANLELNNNEGFLIDQVRVNDHSWSSESDEFRSDEDTFVVKIWVYNSEDKHPNISYCGGECGEHYNVDVYKASNGGIYVYTVTVTGIDHISLSIVDGPSIEEMNQHDEPHFDGKAYVLWSCGSGTCYHYFDAIPDFDDGNSTFYKDTDIKADNDPSISFDMHADKIAWALAGKFARWREIYLEKNNLTDVDWTQVDPEEIISENPPRMEEWESAAIAAYENDPETGCAPPANESGDERERFQACVDEYYIAAGNMPFIRLQPLNEPSYNNSIVSYGDRNFKIVIYNSNYKGVAIGDLNHLNYYPSSWNNPFVKRDQFDISGTTKSKPTGIDTILLEDTVNIKALSDYNGFTISSIVPLDVPDGAVTVTPNNGEFSIEFSSNFYDNVTFEVTDSHGGKSYMLIQRYTVDGYFKYNRQNRPVVAAEFYYDREKSYNDFDLTLKIVYKDGTTKSVLMAAQENFEDALGNPVGGYATDEEAAGGKGLRQSYYEYELEDGEIDTIDKMYINAEYAGSTSSNYAGAYVGSGEGVVVKVYRGE